MVLDVICLNKKKPLKLKGVSYLTLLNIQIKVKKKRERDIFPPLENMDLLIKY